MTNKEAVDIVKRFLRRITKADVKTEPYQYGWVEGYLHLEESEALNIVINVLEREECEDAISREDAERRLEQICEKYHQAYGEDYGELTFSYALYHAFDDLPNVHQKHGTDNTR